MNAKILVLFLVCLATTAAAGCSSAPAGPASTPAPSAPGTTSSTQSVPATPAGDQFCTSDEDCVPAQCCHPTSCTNTLAKQPCNLMCTMVCEGPIDCGAGSCGCVGGMCSIVPASSAGKISVKLEASPQQYSPMMSSTPGIALTPTVTGFEPAAAISDGNTSDFAWNTINYEWNATYGRFLTWDAPDYKVHDIGNPVATDGRKIYWTFTDKPASIKDPVTITVTARDMSRRGAVLGSATVTLNWDGDTAVYIGEIR